jgi:hypothetical protein
MPTARDTLSALPFTVVGDRGVDGAAVSREGFVESPCCSRLLIFFGDYWLPLPAFLVPAAGFGLAMARRVSPCSRSKSSGSRCSSYVSACAGPPVGESPDGSGTDSVVSGNALAPGS